MGKLESRSCQPKLPTVRRKRRSKYDIPKVYTSSIQPHFVSYPGHSKFHDHESKTLTHGKQFSSLQQ